MRKKRKYYDFYVKCMDSGEMPKYGLCGNFPFDEKLELFEPTRKNCLEYHVQPWYYWGSVEPGAYAAREFNETRQTIVLFLAAMNGEL